MSQSPWGLRSLTLGNAKIQTNVHPAHKVLVCSHHIISARRNMVSPKYKHGLTHPNIFPYQAKTCTVPYGNRRKHINQNRFSVVSLSLSLTINALERLPQLFPPRTSNRFIYCLERGSGKGQYWAWRRNIYMVDTSQWRIFLTRF